MPARTLSAASERSSRDELIREPLAIELRQAEAPLVLALDVGTSGLRVFLFDAKARPIRSCIAHSDRPLRTSSTGEASLDADERARAATLAIDEVLRQAGRRADEIAAVATSTFWHSLLGIDARGRPTTRLITWADTRPRGAAARLRAELDERLVHARTGCMLHASYLPAKLIWLRAAEPDAYARTVAWLSFGEYLYLKVFGERRAGHGMASATGLYDQRRQAWDRPILERVGTGEKALSPIDDRAVEGMRPPFARRWKALARVPWVPALGDGACSNVGAGAVRRDTAALMLATSGAFRVVFESDEPPVVRGGWTYRLDARRITAGGSLSNASNVLSWLGAAFPGVDQRRAISRAVDAHGLTALPLLAGDRSPTWNDAARAAIYGLRLSTSAEDVVQAMQEGIALRVALLARLVQEALPGIATIVVTGGAALARPRLIQLCADAVGRALVASAAGEGSARGAAIVGLERIGALADIGAAPAPRGRTFRPRPEAHARLQQALARQTRLQEAVRDFS